MATRDSIQHSSQVHADVPGLTRRAALTLAAGTAAATTAAALAANKALGAPAGACVPDPIFALIEGHKARLRELEELLWLDDFWHDESGELHLIGEVIAAQREAGQAHSDAAEAVFGTQPTTLAGAAVLLRWFNDCNADDIYDAEALHLTLADALDRMAVAS